MTLASASLDVASLVELLAAVVIAVHAVRAGVAIVQGRGSDPARLILAQGVLAALGFSLAATLLKVLALQGWAQIRIFATVFVLRTVLKQVFLGEQLRMEARVGTAARSMKA